jgi:hypothetical protein
MISSWQPGRTFFTNSKNNQREENKTKTLQWSVFFIFQADIPRDLSEINVCGHKLPSDSIWANPKAGFS